MGEDGLRVMEAGSRPLRLCVDWLAAVVGSDLVFHEGDALVERRVFSLVDLAPGNLFLIDRQTLAVGYPGRNGDRGEFRLLSLDGAVGSEQVFRCERPTAYHFGVGLRAAADTLVVRAQRSREHVDAEEWFVVLHRQGQTWRAEAEIHCDSGTYDFAVDDDQFVIIGWNAMCFFRRAADGTWPQVSRIEPSPSARSASLQGDSLAVGGAGDVSVYHFDGQRWHAGAAWRVARAGTYPTVAVALQGEELAVGCGARSGKVKGTVTLFRRTGACRGDEWKEVRKLKTGFLGNHIEWDGRRLLYCRFDQGFQTEALLVDLAALSPPKSARPSRRAPKASAPPDQAQLSLDAATTPDLSTYERLRRLSLSPKVKRAPGLRALLQRRPGLQSLSVPRAALLSPPPQGSPLRELHVVSSTVADIGFLAGFPELEALSLGNRGCKVTDLGPLRFTPSLRALEAPRHKASSLTALSGLNRLQTLSMPQCKALTSLDGLESCPNLRTVDLNQCPGITTLAPLQGGRSLRELKLRGARVTNIAPLYGASALEILFVERTRLASLDGIAQGLPGLRLLWLHKTRVQDIAPLTGLGTLEELDLASLKVKDYTPLSSLPALKYLDLFGTRFTDISLLSSLPSLVHVRLARTPVDADDPVLRRLDETLRARDEDQGGVSLSEASGWARVRHLE